MRHETMDTKVFSPTLNLYIKIKPYPTTNVANQWGGDQKEDMCAYLGFSYLFYFLTAKISATSKIRFHVPLVENIYQLNIKMTTPSHARKNQTWAIQFQANTNQVTIDGLETLD